MRLFLDSPPDQWHTFTMMRTLGDFPNLTAAMEHEGWPETKIRKIMGENWLRLLADVWGE